MNEQHGSIKLDSLPISADDIMKVVNDYKKTGKLSLKSLNFLQRKLIAKGLAMKTDLIRVNSDDTLASDVLSTEVMAQKLEELVTTGVMNW